MLFTTYHPPSQWRIFGEVGKSLDKYSQIYIKFLLIGGFDAEASEEFLHNYNAVNIIHENTCYKSMNNSSCIDSTCIITNRPNSFKNTSAFCTVLSDFHWLLVTVLKISFRKTVSNEIDWRDYNKFKADVFNYWTGAKFSYQQQQLRKFWTSILSIIR